MKTLIISSFLLFTAIHSFGSDPKLKVKEADKNKISKIDIDNGAPTVMLANNSDYTIESYQICINTPGGKECFDQMGAGIQRGAKDNLKLLESGEKFTIKNVKVRDTKTGKVKKICGKSYKVI